MKLMNINNQTEEQTQLANSIEQIRQSDAYGDELEQKKQKIHDDAGLLLSPLVAQLSPESAELLRKLALLKEPGKSDDQVTATAQAEQSAVAETREQADASDQSGSSHNSDSNGAMDGFAAPAKSNSTTSHVKRSDTLDATKSSDESKSDIEKRRAELDGMMLAALSGVIGPQIPMPATPGKSTANQDATQGDNNKSLNSIDINGRGQSESNNHNKATDKDNDGATAQHESGKNLNPAVNVVAQVVPQQTGYAGQFTADRAEQVTTNAIAGVSPDKDVWNSARGDVSTVGTVDAEKKSNKAELGKDAFDGKGNDDLNTHGREKKKERDPADDIAAPQMTAPAQIFPTMMDVPPQPQNSSPSQTQQAMEQQRKALSTQDGAGSTEGVRYNLDSWGQNQSVQIAGTFKDGYKLRPSDQQVQRVLEKYNDDSLNITIESAPQRFDNTAEADASRVNPVNSDESEL
jgi:hypothetical protein